MCWHKWGKWSEPRKAGVVGYYFMHVWVQDRFCTKCGKYKQRLVN